MFLDFLLRLRMDEYLGCHNRLGRLGLFLLFNLRLYCTHFTEIFLIPTNVIHIQRVGLDDGVGIRKQKLNQLNLFETKQLEQLILRLVAIRLLGQCLKYGYHKLIEHLVAFLNKSSIRLNERVEHIDWSSSSDGLVTLKSFNTLEKKYKIYKADCVVVTIPLGVLKKTHSNLFSPSLPQNKVKAIERLGFGTVNKIFTVFEKPIGDKELSSLQILWYFLIIYLFCSLKCLI